MIGKVEGSKTNRVIPRNVFAVGVAQREVRSLSTFVRKDSVPYDRRYTKAEEKLLIDEEIRLIDEDEEKQLIDEEQLIDKLGLSDSSEPTYNRDIVNGVFNEELGDILIEESLLEKYVVGISKKQQR